MAKPTRGSPASPHGAASGFSLEFDFSGINDVLVGYSYIVTLIDNSHTTVGQSGEAQTGHGAALPNFGGWLRATQVDVSKATRLQLYAYRDGKAPVWGTCALGPHSVKNQFYLVKAVTRDATVTGSTQDTQTRQGPSWDWTGGATGKVTIGPKWGLASGEAGVNVQGTRKGAVNTQSHQQGGSVTYTAKDVTGLEIKFSAGPPQYSMINTPNKDAYG